MDEAEFYLWMIAELLKGCYISQNFGLLCIISKCSFKLHAEAPIVYSFNLNILRSVIRMTDQCLHFLS